MSGPNLNETSIVSGGYGGTTEGIIPTSSIKGSVLLYSDVVLSLSLSDIYCWLCAEPLTGKSVGGGGYNK